MTLKMTLKMMTSSLLLLFLLSACNQASEAGYNADAVGVDEEALMAYDDATAAHTQAAPGAKVAAVTFTSAQAPSNNTVAASQKKLIKRADIRFETKDQQQAYASIKQMVAQLNGYVAAEQQNNDYNRIQWTMTLRVPAASFDPGLDSLQAIAGLFDHKQVSVTDVTEEFVDIEIRLKNKRAVAERYRQLLQEAKNIKDILEIEEKLRALREEIEAKEGRLRYLKNQVGYSTIQLQFYELKAYEYRPVKTASFGAKALESIDAGWKGFKGFLLGAMALWPLFLIGFGTFFTVRRVVKQRRIKKKDKSPHSKA